MYHPWCSKCKRIVVFSGGRPSLITNNNTWMEPQRRMVTMAWINSVIHHNGVYVHSDPQCHYYSWEGKTGSSREIVEAWMLLSIYFHFVLSSSWIQGLSPLICWFFFFSLPFFSVLPQHYYAQALLYFTNCQHLICIKITHCPGRIM